MGTRPGHHERRGQGLPDTRACLEAVRAWRWPDGVDCPHCPSGDIIRKGTTRKGAQRYRCRGCSSIYNDLTGTVFADHQLSIPEMFYILASMEDQQVSQIAHRVDRTYKSVLRFVQEVDARETAGVAGLPSPPGRTA